MDVSGLLEGLDAESGLMVLACDKCGVRLGLPKRVPVCPYCGKPARWVEPLTEDDKTYLRTALKIAPD